MPGSYLALVNTAHGIGGSEAVRERLAQMSGMQQRAGGAAFTVFAAHDTPSLELPGGAMVIGQLYTPDGRRIDHRAVHAWPTDGDALRDHVIRNVWGDYVLLQPGTDTHTFIRATRGPSPACDVQCFHASAGVPFLTSDIPLAERLGLYRRRADIQHIAHRLAYPDLKPSHTGLAGISELLPGCTLQMGDGGTRISVAWDPWRFVEAPTRFMDSQEAVLAIRTAVQTVIRTWAAEDESILLELSGGLDSSIVGACLKGVDAQVSCVTLRTPVPGADERDYARLIADMLGIELMEAEVGFDDARHAFPLSAELATPFVGPLQYGIDTLLRKAADREDVRGYYSGGGGDTVFGYLTSAAPAADAFRAAGPATGMRALADISKFHQCTYWKAGYLTLRKLVHRQREQFTVDLRLLSRQFALPAPNIHPWMSTPPSPLAGDLQRIRELSALQFARDSCPRALTRRLRLPLLSQPVIEACLRVPSWMWFLGGQNRAIARLAFAQDLPEKILRRKSKGTFTSFLGALYRRRIAAMVDFLADGALAAHGLLDVDALRALKGGDMPKGDIAFTRVFQLCMLENWTRQQS